MRPGLIRLGLASIALYLLGACAAPIGTVSSVRFAEIIQPQGVARSNLDLAEDFLELTFKLEDGDRLEGLLRYEMPVRIFVHSATLAPYRRDLDILIARLRAEAEIDVALTDDAQAAQIHLEVVPAAQIERVFPTAACFIVPGATDWASFRRHSGSGRKRWRDQKTLEGAAIFLPVDTTPQDVRDCLHEEITQALGPANDLYRLPDSVWNDDNFHSIATRFDMLMLRTLYQPELRSGMSRGEVAALLPEVLARLNPDGRSIPREARHPESRAWASAIEAALARRVPLTERRGAAQVATQIAAEMRPRDHRLGVSLLTLGRLNLRRDPGLAARQFADAYALLRDQFGPEDIRTAQAAVHLAAIAVKAGHDDTALGLAERYIPVARTGQNAILMAGFLSIKAEALESEGATGTAQAARLDSLRWARYGFGDDDGMLARQQAELAALLELEDES